MNTLNINSIPESQEDVAISFNIKKKVMFGQSIFVSGNTPEFGNWKLPFALKLNWITVRFFKVYLLIKIG